MTNGARAIVRVDPGILLHKLNSFGFSENACKPIKSYIYSRQQEVKIGNELSNTFIATSGVPQGSNLGHLVFRHIC